MIPGSKGQGHGVKSAKTYWRRSSGRREFSPLFSAHRVVLLLLIFAVFCSTRFNTHSHLCRYKSSSLLAWISVAIDPDLRWSVVVSTTRSSVSMFSKKKSKLAISEPANFEHRVHTGYDPVRGALVGLPAQWANIVDSTQAVRPRPIVDPSLTTPLKVWATWRNCLIYVRKTVTSVTNLRFEDKDRVTVDILLIVAHVTRHWLKSRVE